MLMAFAWLSNLTTDASTSLASTHGTVETIRVATDQVSPLLHRARKGNDMKILMILNDPPYGTERVYNGLRLAMNLQKNHSDVELAVFLLGDAASAAKSGQQTPEGYYNLERMLASVARKGARVLVCGTCMNVRGLNDLELVAGANRSTMDELAQATVDADKVLVF
jgi:uncharacterized protein involved in oxidation of intracellular sulfur